MNPVQPLRLMGRLLLAALAVSTVGACAATQSARPAGPPAHGLGMGEPAPLPRSGRGALPDTVLARVGRDRDITLSDLVLAARKLDARTPIDSVTPQQARQFLDVLIDRAVLERRAGREPWTWTAQESARVTATRDRAMLSAVLDSVTATWRARRLAAGDTVRTIEALGVIARDSSVALLEPRFDRSLLERLALAFDSIPRATASMPTMEQIRVAGLSPMVSPADSAAVLAETLDGPYLAGELLDTWRRLNPLYRPRIASPAQVADLARNGIFERQLRRIGRVERLDQRADIARAVQNERNFTDVAHFVQREVYDRIPTDSVTLKRWFHETSTTWNLPPRARILRLVLQDSIAAQAIMRRLRSASEAESLVAIAERAHSSFRTTVAANGPDSLVYRIAAAAGPGAVPAPWLDQDGWRVIRVEELLPARPRTIEEAGDAVRAQWIAHDAERRMRELLDDLRKAEGVRINEARLRTPLTPPPSKP